MFVIVRLLPFVVNIGSASFRRRVVEIFPSKSIQAARELSDLMDKTSREILDSKRRALAEGNEAVHRQVGAGKDIMSVLCTYSLFCLVSLNADLKVLYSISASKYDRK